jgi:hypothetical protein
MKTNSRSLLLAASTAALWLAAALQAVQFIPLSLEELTAQSDVVLRGTVQSKTCLRDEAGRIYTRIDLDVAETWKGASATNRFTVVQAGGVLGNRRVEVSGQPDFTIGEEVVLFLVLNSRGEGVVLGVAQGKFEVSTDQATGEKLARNLFHGGSGSGGNVAKAGAATTTSRLTVADLKQRVQGNKR